MIKVEGDKGRSDHSTSLRLFRLSAGRVDANRGTPETRYLLICYFAR
jgi:hypothetical protein